MQALAIHTAHRDTAMAAAEIVQNIRAGLDDAPHALVVFASARHDYAQLLNAFAEAFPLACVAGASSAGEFTDGFRGEGAVSVLALLAPDASFSVGVGRDVGASPRAAGSAVVSGFRGLQRSKYPYKAALVMTDALAGFADSVVEELTIATRGEYGFFGGGAGDDGLFQSTHVFAGREVLCNAVVALEILSNKPIGIGVSHGWEPAGPGLRVTEVESARIVSLNGLPAVHAFEDHARETGKPFDPAAPVPFFLHNIIGIASPGGYRLRVPLEARPDGSIVCAAEVPPGAIVHLMRTSEASAVRAAQNATRSALDALAGSEPAVGIVFDCVATRLRMGDAFAQELQVCAQMLAPAAFVGCNTYGQIARAEGQFAGFHNCTAVVCVLGR